MCRAGETSGSLIHLSAPCGETCQHTLIRQHFTKNLSQRLIFKCSYLSMQIFSTWGTSTCRSRMIVCRGSLHFQERTWDEKKVNFDHLHILSHVQRVLKTKGTDPVWCGSPKRRRRRAWQTSSFHFCFSVENILTEWKSRFTNMYTLLNKHKNTHTYTHVLHCLGLSLTLCRSSRPLRFGLSGLCEESLSLEPTPWFHPLIPATSLSAYRCLQETRKQITSLGTKD